MGGGDYKHCKRASNKKVDTTNRDRWRRRLNEREARSMTPLPIKVKTRWSWKEGRSSQGIERATHR